MTRFPFEIVGFDLDGTLLDTSSELTDSLNHALSVAGLPTLEIEDVRPMIGVGARHMLKVGLEQSGSQDIQDIDRLLPKLLDHYAAHLGTNSPPYPGLLEAMARLDSMQVKMAVVANKYEHLAVRLLENVRLLERFACVIGGDTLGKGRSKPDRAPIDAMIERCGGSIGVTPAAFAGDSIYDVKASHNAGVPVIAVSFGFLHQPLDQLGADAIIDHFDELIPTLHRLE